MGKLPTGDWAANCAYFQLIVFADNLRWGQDAPRLDSPRGAAQHTSPADGGWLHGRLDRDRECLGVGDLDRVAHLDQLEVSSGPPP